VKSSTKPFAICIDDTDYKASLIRGKIYHSHVLDPPARTLECDTRLGHPDLPDFVLADSFWLLNAS
jgi:hypothetical protein